MGELAWFVVERAVPFALVLLSVPLLLLAVLFQALEGPAWAFFAAGMLAWACGIGWGILVNRVGPAMARG